MIASYIALGSNLQQPAEQLQKALNAIKGLPDCALCAVSSFYRSTAVGPGDQPDYLNAVLRLHTKLTPLSLLDALQRIENDQGRTRETRWGARTLDLDILLYGNHLIDQPRLTVPHRAMPQRNFVLYPLLEIAGPNLMLPNGSDLGTLVAACPQGELVKCTVGTHSDDRTVGAEHLQS